LGNVGNWIKQHGNVFVRRNLIGKYKQVVRVIIYTY
jgi:glycerol-3-phosphate O-acyltransferase